MWTGSAYIIESIDQGVKSHIVFVSTTTISCIIHEIIFLHLTLMSALRVKHRYWGYTKANNTHEASPACRPKGSVKMYIAIAMKAGH